MSLSQESLQKELRRIVAANKALIDEALEELATLRRSADSIEETLMAIGCRTPETTVKTKSDAPDHVLIGDDYSLTFEDNFDGSSVDCSKWNSSLIWTRENQQNVGQHLTINNEAQFYVDVCNGEDNLYGNPFTFNNGNLLIHATSQNNLPQTTNGRPGGQPIRSGILTTFDTFCFTYGYVEVCARLPKACGSWPAFWLLHKDYSFNNIAEIDFMEGPISCDPAQTRINANSIQNAYHYTDQFGTQWDIDGWEVRKDGAFDARFFGVCPEVDPALFAASNLRVLNTGSNAIGQVQLADDTCWSDDFHTFGVDWRPGQITNYVDGIPVSSVCEGSAGQTIYDNEMYLILNYAVGGAFPGDPTNLDSFSDTLEIEYARIWTLN